MASQQTTADPDRHLTVAPEGSIEHAAAEPTDPTPPLQIPLPGTKQELTTDFGGNAPDASAVRLKSVSLPVEGEYSRGELLVLRVECYVESVAPVPRYDRWGQEIALTRVHSLQPLSVRKIVAEL